MSIIVRTLVRAFTSWPVAVRRMFVVLLAAVMAVGTLAAAAPKAYAVVTELRDALNVGAALPAPLVASGSSLVVGLNRSVNSGVAWTTDGTLTPMQESGTWLSAYNGVMYGISGSGGAVAYTMSTGAALTSTLPAAAWSQMNSSWALATSDSGAVAYDYLAAKTYLAYPPSSVPIVYGSLNAALGSSGALVWNATSGDGHPLFAVASSPTQAVGPWATIAGIKDWAVTATQLVYAVDTGTGLQVCSRPLTNLSAAPTCVMAWAGSHTAYGADLYLVGSSAFVGVVSYATGATTWYLWNGTTVVGVQVPAGSFIDSPFLGDTAYVVVRDADSVPSFKKVNPDGTLSAGFANPAMAVSTIEGLAVAPGRIIGADNRDGSNQTFPAWSRTVSGTTLGAETALPKRASGLAASARRAAVSNRDGLSLLDGSTVTHTFTDAHLGQLSGPYVTQPLFDANFTTYVLVSKVDGTEVARFPTWTGVLFGSRYMSFNPPSPGGAVSVTVKDLTGTVNDAVVPLVASSASCTSWVAWNDLVAATCDSGHAVRAFSLVDGHLVASTSSTEAWISVKELGDGYAVVIYDSWGDYRLWDLSNNPPTPLVDCRSWTVSDGVGHVACSSSSELIWRDYSSLATSPARVLGWSAPALFSTAAAVWTPEVDVSKPFNAGTLTIMQGTTTIKVIPVPASADGSLRGVSWDGKNGAGAVLTSGTFTAQLAVTGADGSGPVKAIDGSSVPSFQLSRVTPGSFTALSPSRLLDTRDGTGMTGAAAVGAGGVVDLQVAGRGGVPSSGVGAVVLNVTVVTPVVAGYVTVYPYGTTAPLASNLNFTPGQVVPNLVVAKVSADGKVSIKNGSAGFTHLVADVAGYFAGGSVVDPGGVAAVAPYRLLDTRTSDSVGAYGTVTVATAGRGGVPLTGVSAVVVNLTAVTPETNGYLSAYPTGGAVPNSSNVNFVAGQVVPNLAFVKVAADGSFTIRNGSAGRIHVVVDVTGYVRGGTVVGSGMFVPVDPARVLDTRPANGGTGPVAAYAVKQLTMAGKAGVPVAAQVSGIVANVTVVSGASPGYLTVYPADVTEVPLASNLNFRVADAIPNLVAAKSSPAGAIAIYNGSASPVHVIVDVAGYFTS